MANPYLPKWEYIPDGEPRVFGDRVYIYGSHDKAGSGSFCDCVLKCWSAPVDNPNQWVCHGDIFRVGKTRDHESDTDWTGDKAKLFAPDVVEKDGKYFLYAYIEGKKGCVAVSDHPEGPFKVLSQYKYNIPEEVCNGGIFIDPAVFVDDDGRAYIYCGYLKSFLAELNPDNMYEILDDTLIEDFIPSELRPEDGFDSKEKLFFEAASMRKVGDTYYMIYSPNDCPKLAYATSDSPVGPFKFRGYIVDSGADYPDGNDHGSIINVNGQWYIFYHRMTNGSIMSRRGCVERIEILPDGTIPMVETTSLGFETSLNPYQITDADIACILTGGAFVTERNVFSRVIRNITTETVIGYKYFDFGDDFGSKTMEFAAKVRGMGTDCRMNIYIDGVDTADRLKSVNTIGKKIGSITIGHDDSVITEVIEAVTGRHSVFFTFETDYSGWMADYFKGRSLFELESFVFMK
ncbi:Glycosyl hydrolases family 43 [Lachnospiraceae bacterium]|nr:Glycosyl hydrolases family 43 [Lachnospiraceae bacterium]